MAGTRDGYTVLPFDRFRDHMIDWMELMRRQRTIHALVEVDVTDARRAIRAARARGGEPVSFTAFIVGSLAQAVAQDRQMHAYRKGRGALILFDDVDVAIVVERDLGGANVPVGFVCRAADKKSVAEITRDIRGAQNEPAPYARAVRWLPLWLLVPAPIRRFAWSVYFRNPRRRKELSGTVVVTALGMFGGGRAWGIPLTGYSLCLTVGGIVRKPGVVRAHGGSREERIQVREYLSLTISMDHDVIDGAPAARFVTRLKDLIERAVVLAEDARPGRRREGTPRESAADTRTSPSLAV